MVEIELIIEYRVSLPEFTRCDKWQKTPCWFDAEEMEMLTDMEDILCIHN